MPDPAHRPGGMPAGGAGPETGTHQRLDVAEPLRSCSRGCPRARRSRRARAHRPERCQPRLGGRSRRSARAEARGGASAGITMPRPGTTAAPALGSTASRSWTTGATGAPVGAKGSAGPRPQDGPRQARRGGAERSSAAPDGGRTVAGTAADASIACPASQSPQLACAVVDTTDMQMNDMTDVTAMPVMPVMPAHDLSPPRRRLADSDDRREALAAIVSRADAATPREASPLATPVPPPTLQSRSIAGCWLSVQSLVQAEPALPAPARHEAGTQPRRADSRRHREAHGTPAGAHHPHGSAAGGGGRVAPTRSSRCPTVRSEAARSPTPPPATPAALTSSSGWEQARPVIRAARRGVSGDSSIRCCRL